MKAFQVLIITFAIHTIAVIEPVNAQDPESNTRQDRKAEKEAERARSYAHMDSLLNSRQFVFQPELYQGSYMTFVVVDSFFGEVQNGNRNNLQGHITQYEVKKNEKKKTLSVSVKMRGTMDIADVFIFVGANGKGTATVKSAVPENFSFTGYVVDFENASIYEGRSHFVH